MNIGFIGMGIMMRVQKMLLHSPEVRDQKSEVSKDNWLYSQAVSQMNVK